MSLGLQFIVRQDYVGFRRWCAAFQYGFLMEMSTQRTEHTVSQVTSKTLSFGSGLINDRMANFKDTIQGAKIRSWSSKKCRFCHSPLMPVTHVSGLACSQYRTKSCWKSGFFSRAPLWPRRGEFSSKGQARYATDQKSRSIVLSIAIR